MLLEARGRVIDVLPQVIEAADSFEKMMRKIVHNFFNMTNSNNRATSNIMLKQIKLGARMIIFIQIQSHLSIRQYI